MFRTKEEASLRRGGRWISEELGENTQFSAIKLTFLFSSRPPFAARALNI